MGYYKLYTDKSTNFECKIGLTGANMKNASARLVLETPQHNFLFKGQINKGGRCSIPIGKLKGLLPEDAQGTLKLEVIVDDTYFQPWESPFQVVAAKRLRVEVMQPQSKKTSISVSVQGQEEKYKLEQLSESVTNILKKKKITAENVLKPKNRKFATKLIGEAINRTGGDIETHDLLEAVINRLK